MKIKTFSKDFLYTFGSQIVMNAIQHLFVFPWINKTSGPETAGRILACLSIVYIFSTSLGNGMTSVRLIEERKNNGTNGDYLTLLSCGSLFIYLVVLVAKHYGFDPQVSIWWFALLAILNMIRTYGVVDFRIHLHFSAYFIFYILISIGYAIGVLIYKQTNNWTHIFISGEILGILMLCFRKYIFDLKKPSDKLAYLGKAVTLLFLSALMIQIIVSGDRLILKYILGDRVVTIYSSLSLAAKIMNMVVLPLGTLLLSYITAKTIPLTKKWLFKISSVWVGFCLLAFIGTCIVSPIYVYLFYNNLYDEIQGLNIIVNAGLGLALIGFFFRIYLIASSSASIVFWFETFCTVTHLIVAVILTRKYGMFGYAWAVIISRAMRAAIGSVLTLYYVNKYELNTLKEATPASEQS